MTRTAPVLQTGSNDHSQYNSGTGGAQLSGVLPKPVNMDIGDLLVAFVTAQGTLGSGQTLTEQDAGWIHLGPAPSQGTGQRPSGIWVFPVVSSPSGISNSSWRWLTGGAAGRWLIDCYRITGADLTDYIDAVSPSFASTAANGASSAVIPSMTTTVENALLLYHIHCIETTAQGLPVVTTQPAECTFVSEQDSIPAPLTSSADSLLIWKETKAVAGATGTRTFDKSVAMTAWNGYGVSIKGIDGGGPPPDPEPAALVIFDGVSDKPMNPHLRVYAGPQTITSLMASNMAYCAHRGGSKNFPEETLYAYKQAHNRGLRALEISVWKTSDGHWACSHDRSTLRTTGVDYDITTKTRAELAALTVMPVGTDDQTQSRRPFAFLDEVLALYGEGGPVLFIEDKQGTNQTAFLAFLNTYDNPTQRFMIKTYGPGGATAKAAYRAAGYKIWNYYFNGTDMDSIIVGGVVGGNIESCDYVGLDYNLSDSNFSLVVAYGKPVFAHIIDTTARRDRVKALGAVGMMVSDIKTVVPGASNI